ncbi:MAG: nitroreductase family protein, partial [Pseudomonadota bacterium]
MTRDLLYELMSTRRSVRRFKAETPSRESIERLIESAITAPSAGNQQPWQFLVVANKGMIVELASAVREAAIKVAEKVRPSFRAAFRNYAEYFSRFENAPVVIVVLWREHSILSRMVDESPSSVDRTSIAQMEYASGLVSASLALQNLLLMAHASGLGATAMTGPLLADDRVRSLLSIALPWRVAAFVPVGFPDEQPSPTGRKPADR